MTAGDWKRYLALSKAVIDDHRTQLVTETIDLLVATGKSKMQLGREMGVSQATLSLWLSGKRHPSADHAMRLLDCIVRQTSVILKSDALYKGLQALMDTWQEDTRVQLDAAHHILDRAHKALVAHLTGQVDAEARELLALDEFQTVEATGKEIREVGTCL